MHIAYTYRLKHRAKRGLYFGICLALSLLLFRCGKEEIKLSQPDAANLVANVQFAYVFGLVEVGFSKSHVFEITNEGDLAATEFTSHFNISSFQYVGGFPGAQGTCTDVIEPGASCDLEATFAPANPSQYTEVLRLIYFNGVEDVVSNLPELNGTGYIP